MPDQNRHHYAILTGDLVGSRRLSGNQIGSLFAALNDFWEAFGHAHPGAVVGKIEIYRGDGWQAALELPQYCLKAALFLRAVVKAYPLDEKMDTRIGIGLGPVELLKKDRLSESNGTAFVRSGEALETLTEKDQGLALRTGATADPLQTVGCPMMDLAIRRLTRPEAVAVMGSLLSWKQETIAAHPYSAKKDGETPTQQSVSDSLVRIGWKSHWLPVLTAVETVLESPS
ncbi:MAG: hypothetical protein ACFCU4_04060 [Puniceicoccaceae bacterium]